MNFVKAPDRIPMSDMERLISAYGDSILRMCYTYLKDMPLAEDAMQETFLKVYRQYPAFRQACSEKTWVMRIAINTCKDMRRSAWFRRVDRSITPDMVPEASATFDAQDDAVIMAIMNLPPKLKAVILLRYYQELSFSEIAEALEIPMGTVSTRMNAAKKKLRAKLERWYFDE
ncbi:MAG: sigma-70 family RNA polymerase sigma factor [Oscillospiraceae bacterium]|jgi:RNA polymerase sigma-70 factor (ECF subfamily)|nr:sigma-70 family RNA polymerase sigma factor [Oscillospiraceae bacterium]